MTNTDPMIGRILGGTYRVEQPLGSGGMGAVYIAVHQRTGRRVALKILRSEHAVSTQALERFRREAELLATLGHPSIVSIHDSNVTDDGTPFFVMDRYDGETLGARLARGPLPWTDALRVFMEVASALATAHEAGVIHRDIKPDNVFLARFPNAPERAIVLDFGLARSVDPGRGSSLTHTGSLMGTPMYLSPELAVGEPADARTDIYSLAAVMFEMLSGAPPIVANNLGDQVTRVLTEVPVLLSTRAPGRAPAAMDAVLARALAKQRDQRYATMSDFATAVIATTAVATGPSPASVPRTAPMIAAPALAPIAHAASLRPAEPSVARRIMGLATLVGSIGVGALLVWMWARAPAERSAAQRITLVPIASTPEAPLSVPPMQRALVASRTPQMGTDDPTWQQTHRLVLGSNYGECAQIASFAARPRSFLLLCDALTCGIQTGDVDLVQGACDELEARYPAHPMTRNCPNVLHGTQARRNSMRQRY